MPLPAPPPPPPPGPPPLGGLANSMSSSNVKSTPASSNNRQSPSDRSNLLNEIRKAGGMGGKIQLKKVVTNDRSAPSIGGNSAYMFRNIKAQERRDSIAECLLHAEDHALYSAKSSSPLSNGSSAKISTVSRAVGNQMTNKMSFQEQLNSAIKANKLSSSHSSSSIHSAISDGYSPQHATANGNGIISKNDMPECPFVIHGLDDDGSMTQRRLGCTLCFTNLLCSTITMAEGSLVAIATSGSGFEL
uniref:WH2 domain-containing protein n=1 Tax=Romanomermis culicivorax TaxID=13658 RepID=A0A915HZ77_ROMCU